MSRSYILCPCRNSIQLKNLMLVVIAFLCLLAKPAKAQVPGNMYYPIDAGYYVSSSFSSFYDSQNNISYNGFGNNYGQPSDDVWYTFTVGSTTNINISLCGSDFDTYLHLLDGNMNELESNDDNGPLCIGSQSSIKTTLTPGTYYVVAEGYGENCGNISLVIDNTDINSSIQYALNTAIDAGSFGYCGSRIYTDYKNNSSYNGYGNKFGQPSDDIFYKMTISETTLVNISLCGSNFDTYLHLLNGAGAEIESNDDNGPLCSGFQSSIQTTLSPGTYYIVAEGFSLNSGDLALEVSNTGNGSLPPGATLATAIDAGSLSTPFIDTKNISADNCYLHFIGQSSPEIYYKFALNARSKVSISHCGSAVNTYMHLLNNSGAVILTNDGNGPLCDGGQASIRMFLDPGIYYVVSEEKSDNIIHGNITTSISSAVYPLPTANLSQNQNYIVTYSPKVSGMLDADSIAGQDISRLTQEVQYFDGLGRLKQTVVYKGSPGLNDMVQPVCYDVYGRETKKYLPYATTSNDGSFKENGITEQASFYAGNVLSAKCAQDGRPYVETFFEPSPLNRPLKLYGSGSEWYTGDHKTEYANESNESNEVKHWITGDGTLNVLDYYAAGTLKKTKTTDENGNNSWEYMDLQNRVVLKQVEDNNGALLNTYYVYDAIDRLAYIVPPKAISDTYTEGSSDFSELLYAYHYDNRNRLIEKHVPGTGWTNMVYNRIDELILSQDARQQQEGKWIFTKYDAFGRTVMTGSLANSSTRENIQSGIDNNETILWETRNNNFAYAYTSDAYPQSSIYSYEVLTVNYYDTYGFDYTIPVYQQISGNPANSSMTTGLLTGSKVKVLDNTNTWLTTVNYYDDKGLPLQVHSQNILGAWDKATSVFDFTGKVVQNTRTHDALTIKNTYTYDHVDRKKEVFQQTGSGPEVELAQYHYNELGQLVKKYLHGDISAHLQSIDYRYNIRGWLTSINNAGLEVSDNNEDSFNAFGEELSYNGGFLAGGFNGSAQWNGNISGMSWKSKGPSVATSGIEVNGYAFEYDKLNRLKLANYGSGAYGSNLVGAAGRYNEQLTYDEMGNIKTLMRNGMVGTIDNLTYHYRQNGLSNQLASITDASNDPTGFKKVNYSGDDYIYDASGNLTDDKNKGLTISYNILNLPQTVSSSLQSGTIGYIYDAMGRKLKKTFTGQPDHYYFDGIEYRGTNLLFAMTEEGRVRLGAGGYTYDYFLRDHLSNIRVVLGTDNTNQSMVYPAATMETMSAATESTYYSNLDKVRSFTPVGFKSVKKNEKVAHLKGTDPNRQIGPSITVKVNSGDTINLTAQSFYPDNKGSERTGLAETALSQLVNAIVNPAGLSVKGKAFAVDNLKAQGFSKGTSYQNMMNKLPNSDYKEGNDRPKAYMVWMLFDKEMKLVKTGRSSGARQIPEGAGQVKQMAESGIVMDQGGFLTAYTINESPASVYIDNFQLSVASGGLLEENHYYPFGMLNEGLSQSDNTDPINNYKFNGKELQNELSLHWLDYGKRFYDPVIGRWHNVDLVSELFFANSPYLYCINNPLKYVDVNGLWPIEKVVDHGRLGNRGFTLSLVRHPVTGDLHPHHGQDFTVSAGNNVHSLAGGIVTKVGNQYNEKSQTGWGYYVEVKHSNGYITRYAHLTKGSMKVKEGQKITDGYVLALSGASGGVSGAHLHVEMLLAGKPVNPMLIRDLQLYLNEINSSDEEAVNSNNPTMLGEVTITGKGPSRIEPKGVRAEDIMWQLKMPNSYGNTGRYNRPGRTMDENYSDDFLKWYYKDNKQK